MSWKHDSKWSLERGEENIDVIVDFTVDHWGSGPTGMFGPPEDYDPGSPAEIYVTKAVRIDTSEEVKLTDAEEEAFCRWVEENADNWADSDAAGLTIHDEDYL